MKTTIIGILAATAAAIQSAAHNGASLPNFEDGEVIYNSTTKKLNFYNGTAWEAVTSAP